MTKGLNFPITAGLEPVQKYLKSLMMQKKVTCYLCEEEIDIDEALSPVIGLPKLIQQALLTDYFSGTNFVWDSGIYLEKHDKSYCGHIVRTREPKAGMGKTPLYTLLYDCVKVGTIKKDNINQLHLDNLPVFCMKNISGSTENITVDWAEDMEDFFTAKEEAYSMMNLAESLNTGTEGVEYAFVR